eukprot:7755070-Pyramimonas_sp.AAC.1
MPGAASLVLFAPVALARSSRLAAGGRMAPPARAFSAAREPPLQLDPVDAEVQHITHGPHVGVVVAKGAQETGAGLLVVSSWV